MAAKFTRSQVANNPSVEEADKEAGTELDVWRGARMLLWCSLLLTASACRSVPSVRLLEPTPVRDPSGSIEWVPLVGVVPRPLPWPPERAALTLDYARLHYGEGTKGIVTPRMIVLHWSEIPTLDGLYETFAPSTLGGGRPELAGAGAVNVSSQFGVDRDGTIYQFLPETFLARHVIGLNPVAIGVENVGGTEQPLTAAQVRANARIIRQLVAKYPSIRYLIGHFEYGAFRGTPMWAELDPRYFTEKIDPGPEFMAAVRVAVADLNLAEQ
jgi:N-acetylmuramoyl-L-alanine amidase